MKNTTTAFLATTLLTALFASGSAIADGDANDEYSIGKVWSSGELANRVNYSIESSPISAELDAELFPTDHPVSLDRSTDRVNYSIDVSPTSAKLDAELFPEHNR